MVAIPEWFFDAVPTDVVLGQAYESVPPRLRSWLKLTIARLHTWHSVGHGLETDTYRSWRQGFVSLEHEVPCVWTVLILDADFYSPVRLLAALLPALVAGVKTVLVVRLQHPWAQNITGGQDWPSALLVAMELAGQELLSNCTVQQIKTLIVGFAREYSSGTVVALGEIPRRLVRSMGSCLADNSELAYWMPQCPRSIGLWCENGQTWDWEALTFVHPDMIFIVGGTPHVLPPPGFSIIAAPWSEFLRHNYQVLCLPVDRIETAWNFYFDQALPPVVLGPGHEACFFWPDGRLSLFRRRSGAWFAVTAAKVPV
ncbi:conserved hypothetical protein [Desulfovibrionales bacterium]